MNSDRDLYQILQIDPAAEQEVVQAAFKRLAFKYHPDKNQSPDANQRMQELNEAYAIIADPGERAAYDQQRQAALAAQRRMEDEARRRAEAQQHAELVQQRREQAAAERRAENERRQKARAAAAYRRAEHEQQVREQATARRQAEYDRQQREWAEAQQPGGPTLASSDAPVQESVTTAEVQFWIEADQNPVVAQRPTESERQQIALTQGRQALQNEIFKLDYGITDAAERLKYWSRKRIRWEIEVRAGQGPKFVMGITVTIIALVLAGLGLWLGGGAAWAAVCCLIGAGAGWWTWCNCLSVVPVEYFVAAWTEVKRRRELQLQKLKAELAQLEIAMQINASGVNQQAADK